MEQHPIPQQISSYQFRLVGDMTLRQFFQVGGGALVAFILYNTGLPGFVKWPLMLISFGLGAALAFLPFQERPLSDWIFAFFRSIYSPTVYLWMSYKNPAIYYKEESEQQLEKKTFVAPHGEKALDAYLKGTPDQNSSFLANLDGIERNFLKQISALIKPGGSGIAPVAEEKTTKQPVPEVQPVKPPEIETPQSQPVGVASKGFRPKIVIEEKQVIEEEKEPKSTTTTTVAPILTDTDGTSTSSVQFSVDAAPPNPPIMPNTIVGQVMDENKKIIEGAILEIKDISGRPVRALRTNKAGHFIIVTALANGQYELITEKEGYVFEPVSFMAEGKMIPPIAIRAKSSTQPGVIPPDGQNSTKYEQKN